MPSLILTAPKTALWVLWAIAHVHGHIHVLMRAGTYDDGAQCERVAALMNSTAPELGYFACFRSSAEKPYTY